MHRDEHAALVNKWKSNEEQNVTSYRVIYTLCRVCVTDRNMLKEGLKPDHDANGYCSTIDNLVSPTEL